MIDYNYIQGAVMVSLAVIQLATRPYLRENMRTRGRGDREIRCISRFSLGLSMQILAIGIGSMYMAYAGIQIGQTDPDEQQVVLGLSLQILSVAATQMISLRSRCLRIRRVVKDRTDGDGDDRDRRSDTMYHRHIPVRRSGVCVDEDPPLNLLKENNRAYFL